MADGFIVRKGGVTTEQTATPSILDFSTASATSIKFKLRNNDSVAATLVYRFGTLTGDGESISVAANTTTSEITFTVPTITTPTSLFVTANATGKVKSEVAEQEFNIFIVFTAATGGTTLEYNSGGKRFRSHTFTSNGNFVVSTVGDNVDDRNKVDYLIIAGGAGGGASAFTASGASGGGGGAGGYRTTLGTSGGDSSAESKVVVTAATFAVTIGSAGAGAIRNGVNAGNGSASSVAFADTITSIGGGYGATSNETDGTVDGQGANGGSGGGGSFKGSNFQIGGTGTSTQGTNGGNATEASPNFGSGGGGGAGIAGSNGTTNGGGNGGNGLANLLRTGSNESRAGGGGGGSFDNDNVGSGGTGGGGTANARAAGSNATAITGSGGGGGSFGNSSHRNGGNGADGTVVIRYEIATV